ncbi:hypothetical protein AVEN_182412-1 [Araneus ventricosus]|uniref:Uncharacterized protein n=1 Tax=Araneus ventricosus TaxID=182803 RepID=A0A4Y2SXG7_ARAVE|nr:hypothetical protein AVEN_77174-1 [Araneus ventricosus]GBN93032.1 hypothetical protein AVEN_172104-1 [Araneus ventricosus]GBN93459.1 hypothetical protein AVEN_17041-1 [Araneus ventricosus]GBN93460.1 hypothetical protein AVEN_182412-1 [Araneus ventricosus]
MFIKIEFRRRWFTHFLMCWRSMAVFRTGARGARLVPSIPEGPQNLFNVHRSAKGKVKLQVWVEGEASKQFCACGLILSKSATAGGLKLRSLVYSQ